MAEGLRSARELVERIRFSGDTLRAGSLGNEATTDAVASIYFRNDLEITPEVTPDLAAQLGLVCGRLHISQSQINAFVYASSELQASCLATGTSKCVLRFSSALVDLLDAEEFSFVCGHELGHFLLGHGIAKIESENASIEYFMQQRAQVISVDRVGFIACGSLDVAIRALMKTASGLNERHLRFDVGTFVSQLSKSGSSALINDHTASHPSILVRCRALLWFTLSDFLKTKIENSGEPQIHSLDERIQHDLDRFVDGPARRQIEDAKNDLAMWMVTYEIVQMGVFDKSAQKIVARMLRIRSKD
jgi:hypothetical protein